MTSKLKSRKTKPAKNIELAGKAAAVAAFGVAMHSAYVTPELQADVVPLTFNGGATATNNFSAGIGTFDVFDMDQVPNVIATAGDFVAFNDDVGRTHSIAGPAFGNLIGLGNSINSGDVIDPATFFGNQNVAISGTFDGTGSAFIAFRTLGNNVGWFKLTFTDQGPIVYGPGQLGTMGESLIVGDADCLIGDVNGDGLINLLDVTPFVDAITNGDLQCEADINQDNEVNLLDVAPFVELLSGG